MHGQTATPARDSAVQQRTMYAGVAENFAKPLMTCAEPLSQRECVWRQHDSLGLMMASVRLEPEGCSNAS